MNEKDRVITEFAVAYAKFRAYVHHPVVLWSEHPNIEQGYYMFGITPEQFEQLKEMLNEG